MKWLVQRPLVQALLMGSLGRYLEFALRTTRWTFDGLDNIAGPMAGAPVIVAFWHERLPLMSALWVYARRHGTPRQAHILVSRHRDGRFIGDLMRRFSYGVVYGSTRRNGQEKGGAASARTLLSLLEAGEVVAITPDGPRGPARVAAPGVAEIAAKSGVPVLPCAAQTKRRVIAPTWDRMIVPLPFGRGVVVCGPLIAVPQGAENALHTISRALSDAADRADRLCA